MAVEFSDFSSARYDPQVSRAQRGYEMNQNTPRSNAASGTDAFVREQFELLNKEGFSNLVEAFLDVCGRHADEAAFKCLGKPLTFGQLEAESRAFAAYLLHEAGLERGDRIAIQLPNLTQYPIVAWGALRAGLILVNTNPSYTLRELAHQLEDSGAVALVVLEDLLHKTAGVIQQSGVKKVITTHALDMIQPQTPAEVALPETESLPAALDKGRRLPFEDLDLAMEDVAVLQYTGGTTGVAKGAVLSQRNLLAGTRAGQASFPIELEEGRREVVIAPMPLYHVYGFTMNVIGITLKGGLSVLIPDPRNIDSLIQAMREEPFTGMASVNTLLIAMMQHPEFDEIDFSTVFGVIEGGAPLVEEIADEWYRRTGVKIYEGYGLSETSASGAVNNINARRLGTVGRAAVGAEFKTVDSEGKRLGTGEEGELLMRGPQVMQGYWQRPDATAEAFDADGWFRTGDVGVIDADGFIKIVDRLKDMVLVSGFNVYPAEIENVLYGHPDVIECAVVGVPDPRSGEAVKAFIVSSNPELTADEVIAFCRQELTAYKVPRHVEFPRELPKSSVGKILRRELKK